MNNIYLEIHELHEVMSPSAMNCDDVGNPKSFTVGKNSRFYFSSQSWSRSFIDRVIESGIINSDCVDYGSRHHISGIKKELIDKFEWEEKEAEKFAIDGYKCIFEDKKKKKDKEDEKDDNKKMQSSAMSLISNGEIKIIAERINDAFLESQKEKGKTNNNFKTILKRMISKRDLPIGIQTMLFGRMFASNPDLTVSATMRKGHMFSISKCDKNTDAFTAFDRLSEGQGSGHLDSKSFSAGLCMYKNGVWDVSSLLNKIKFLYPDFDIKKLLRILIKENLSALPNGKINSYFSKTPPACVLINIVQGDDGGGGAPYSYGDAFSKSIENDNNRVNNAIKQIIKKYKNNCQWSNYLSSFMWVGNDYMIDNDDMKNCKIKLFDNINDLIEKVVDNISS